ncbi:MotA/TolQ/ExbB proton channel family protein [Pseudoalteromonas luteoviolacea]|uniref:MotA/TolQ/ExbB proton channel family protein n=1 Tax=Pseudoalteromonas luteoviolacea TaxID=43657 RepID=UPI00114F88E1|nr:MotA/TolQ/ExbB proton channel family protein [Pseudoalteromonas luteoviolacea]TQF70514.1 MotA/TolQ/ExbB proton channel family protein [Pseudoalteromonas luteoviolacea]
MAELTSLLSNKVVLALLCLASFTYFILFDLYFASPSQGWEVKVRNWQTGLLALISAQPLLGLLGTIQGLLDTFEFISIFEVLSQQAIMSGGISNALITTKLGLVLAIPSLVFRQLVLFKLKKQRGHS